MTTRQEWALGFLAYAGWEVSQEKIIALVAQAAKENGGALFNPLDTEEDAPGATDYNAAGVKSYPSLESGFGATLATFRDGRYPQLVGILSDPAGGSATAYAVNVELNTWGTGNCLAEVESIKAGDPHGYLTHEIAGTAPSVPPGGAPTVPPGGSTPKPRLKGPTMFITTQPLNGTPADWLVSGGVATWIPEPSDLEAYQAAGVVVIQVSAAQFSLFQHQS